MPQSLLDQFRNGVGSGTTISPIHNSNMFVCRSLTKPHRVYFGSDTAKVQSVGIPTGLDCRIIVSQVIHVTSTGHEKQIEIVVVQVEHLATQFSGKTRSTNSMRGVGFLRHTLGVVEDGKELNDLDLGSGYFCKTKPVFQHPGPMSNTVDAKQRQRVLCQNGVNDGLQVQHNAIPTFGDGSTYGNHAKLSRKCVPRGG